MKKQFHFNKFTNNDTLDSLKTEWRKSLTAAQDGMWEVFAAYASQWEIRNENETIGYACVDDENRLLQFYLNPQWMKFGTAVFEQFVKQMEIKTAMVGTNNPIFLSLALHLQKSITIDTYLFHDALQADMKQQPGTLKIAWEEDLQRLIEFCHINMGGPKEWLQGYLSNLISRGEIFMLMDSEEILGTCEVRHSDSNPKVADVGMVVSTDHRRKGLGSFLLGKAKELAYDSNRSPICSCEKDNVGSLKSIRNNGFVSKHQMLLMEF